LLRYRRKLVESQATERNRLQRLLETANIKIASVCSDVFGVSGRQMLAAIIEGEAGPQQMAQLAKGRLRRKLTELARALEGRVEDHHRFLLRMQLGRIQQVEATIAELDGRIDSQLEPYRDQRDRLMQIPGIERVGAAVIIAELGVDMSVFPTHRHAAAWAGVSPGNNESARKFKAQPHRKGNVHLTTLLTQAAVGASKKRGSYLRDKYFRLRARRGPKRAAMAIAHKILVAAYYMLKDGGDYRDLGATYLDQRRVGSTKRTLVKRLEALGYKVSLTQGDAMSSTA
jgi:transposase